MDTESRSGGAAPAFLRKFYIEAIFQELPSLERLQKKGQNVFRVRSYIDEYIYKLYINNNQ